MKKNSKILLCSYLLFLLFFLSCKDNQTAKTNPKVLPDSTKAVNKNLADSSKLVPGEIPEGWKKVNLDKGYYVAFPKKPWKKDLKDKKRIEFHYPQKKYDTYVSLTDLEKEPAFNKNKDKKGVFFEAVIDDLLNELKDTDAQQEKPEIIKKEYFLFQNIYEGVKLELKAKDVHIFIQSVLMGKTLYTLSVLIWEEATSSVLKDKDKFFNSFSKELQVK
jgi:hypothetical protein